MKFPKHLALCLIFGSVSGLSPAQAEEVECATVNWSPYYSSKLPNGGPVTHKARAAFAAAGFQMKVKWTPWARALMMVKKGKYPCLLGRLLPGGTDPVARLLQKRTRPGSGSPIHPKEFRNP